MSNFHLLQPPAEQSVPPLSKSDSDDSLDSLSKNILRHSTVDEVNSLLLSSQALPTQQQQQLLSSSPSSTSHSSSFVSNLSSMSNFSTLSSLSNTNPPATPSYHNYNPPNTAKTNGLHHHQTSRQSQVRHLHYSDLNAGLIGPSVSAMNNTNMNLPTTGGIPYLTHGIPSTMSSTSSTSNSTNNSFGSSYHPHSQIVSSATMNHKNSLLVASSPSSVTNAGPLLPNHPRQNYGLGHAHLQTHSNHLFFNHPLQLTGSYLNGTTVDKISPITGNLTLDEQTLAQTRLFVGDLSYFCTEDNLLSLFSPYGPVLQVHVRRGVKGNTLMHGYVIVDAYEQALRAVKELDNMEFMGRTIVVQLAVDRVPKVGKRHQGYAQIHISFVSKQANFLVNERVLKAIFEQFGTVIDVTIKQHTYIEKQQRQAGYGFVYFKDRNEAVQAVNYLKHRMVNEVTFDCSVCHSADNSDQYADLGSMSLTGATTGLIGGGNTKGLNNHILPPTQAYNPAPISRYKGTISYNDQFNTLPPTAAPQLFHQKQQT